MRLWTTISSPGEGAGRAGEEEVVVAAEAEAEVEEEEEGGRRGEAERGTGGEVTVEDTTE